MYNEIPEITNPEEFMDAFMDAFWFGLVEQIPSTLFSIATYVLMAIGLYTIAKRRGINHPWLAWLPIANHWLVGCISDQYRYVVKGEVKNKRKVLLGLSIAVEAAAVIVLIMLGVMLFDLVDIALTYGENIPDSVVLDALLGPLMSIAGLAIVMSVVSIVFAVFRYMALYDLFRSCDPKNSVMYLVLGIVIGVTMPFFVFFSRKKDLGMPPRKDAQPEPPAYQQPQVELAQPAEPWNPVENPPTVEEPWDQPQQTAEPWERPEENE